MALIIFTIFILIIQPAKPKLLSKISFIIIYKKDVFASNITNKMFKYPNHN